MWENIYDMSLEEMKRKEIWILRLLAFRYIIGRVEYSAQRTL